MTTDKLLYGADIFLNDENDISLNGSDDFVLIEGKQNITQAIKSKLRTELGELTLHTDYGSEINAFIGVSHGATLLSDIRATVRKVLIQEPRIETILSITTKYAKNDEQKIIVSIAYYPIESTEVMNIIYPVFLNT